MRTLILLGGLLLMACPPPKPPPVEPKPQTRYELASHRCAGKSPTCVCRNPANPDDAVETSPIPEKHRRFEVILQSLDPALLVEIAGMPYEFRTTGESLSPACWYIDVPISSHTVTLRAREYQTAPVHAFLSLSEYQPEIGWSQVFQWGCGESSSACTPDEVEAEKERSLNSRGRCARSRVGEMRWQGKTLEDRYVELDLSFTLSVGGEGQDIPSDCKQPAPEEEAP